MSAFAPPLRASSRFQLNRPIAQRLFRRAALVFVAVGVGLTMTNCASVGEPFDAAKMAAFSRGITTRPEVEAALGHPASALTLADGQTVCLWIYTKASNRAQNFVPVVNLVQSRMDVHSQTFTAYFDSRGVLVNFTSNESNLSGKGGLVN